MGKRKYTQAQKDAMVRAYTTGATLREAASIFGASTQVVCSELEKRGIASRSMYDMSYRKHPFDENWFESVDTEEKAYFLGLIATDGNIYANTLKFALNVRDIVILERFLFCVGSKKPISIGQNHGSGLPGKPFVSDMAVCSVNSKKMREDLALLGVYPNKSHTIKPWAAPADRPDLQAAYWRGCVDGDGCLTRINDNNWAVCFCGNEYMVNGFIEWARGVCPTKAKARKGRVIYEAMVGGSYLVKMIVTALYADASIYLPRKYELALQIMSANVQTKVRYDVDSQNITSDYENGMSLSQVAEKYNMDKSSIADRLEKNCVSRRDCKKVGLDSEYIANCYQEGESLLSISKRLGVSEGPIKRILNESGISTRSVGDKRKYLEGMASEIKSLYLEGASIACIRRRYNTSSAVIKSILIGAGVGIRSSSEGLRLAYANGLKPHNDLELAGIDFLEVTRLYKNGVSLKALGREYSVCHMAIKRGLVKRGVPLRTRAESYALRDAKRAGVA